MEVSIYTSRSHSSLIVKTDRQPDDFYLAKAMKVLAGRKVDKLTIPCNRNKFNVYGRLVKRGGSIFVNSISSNPQTWAEIANRFKTSVSEDVGMVKVPVVGPRFLTKRSLSLAVLTHGQPPWLESLIKSLDMWGRPNIPIRVFQDPEPQPSVTTATYQSGSHHRPRETHEEYVKVCDELEVPLFTLPDWGCIQANAQFALENSPEDWVICVQDDNFFTKGCLENVISTVYDWEELPCGGQPALFQIPYTTLSNAFKLNRVPSDRKTFASVLSQNLHYLENWPEDSHWSSFIKFPGISERIPFTEPYLYRTVHGSGFVIARKVWEELGGFIQTSWCYDEDISAKVWMFSPYYVAAMPGPVMIHGNKGYDGRPTPIHTFYRNDGWDLFWSKYRDRHLDKMLNSSSVPRPVMEYAYAAMNQCGGNLTVLSQVFKRKPFMEA